MSSVATQVSQGGRIVIPAEIRKKMNLKTGDQVLLSWDDESAELRLSTRAQRIQRARKLVKQYANPHQHSVVDAFIQERRKAAKDE